MEEEARDHHSHRISPLLQALKKASKDLQANPTYPLLYYADPRPAIEALLELGAQAGISSHPSLSKLSELLSDLKAQSLKLDKLQGYHFRAFFYRQVTKYEISRIAHSIEARIQSFADQCIVRNLLTSLRSSSERECDPDRIGETMADFRARLAKGFDGELQELVLKGRVFSALELALCTGSTDWVRDEAALAILALVEFNRAVFVGLVLMGPAVKSLISISSLNSIQVLCCLIRLIKTPLLDSIRSDQEAVKTLVGLLSTSDIRLAIAVMEVVLEMSFYAPKEVVKAMVMEEGLVEKLLELQRRMEREDFGGDEAVTQSLGRGSCVARLAVSVEVGEGLERRERGEIRSEILRLVGEYSVSEAESAAIVAEILWGSSP